MRKCNTKPFAQLRRQRARVVPLPSQQTLSQGFRILVRANHADDTEFHSGARWHAARFESLKVSVVCVHLPPSHTGRPFGLLQPFQVCRVRTLQNSLLDLTDGDRNSATKPGWQREVPTQNGDGLRLPLLSRWRRRWSKISNLQ